MNGGDKVHESCVCRLTVDMFDRVVLLLPHNYVIIGGMGKLQLQLQHVFAVRQEVEEWAGFVKGEINRRVDIVCDLQFVLR